MAIKRRGDSGAALRNEMLAFIRDVNRQGAGDFTITSTHRPNSEGSLHQTGHAFDLGYRKDTDGLGLLKFLLVRILTQILR